MERHLLQFADAGSQEFPIGKVHQPWLADLPCGQVCDKAGGHIEPAFPAHLARVDVTRNAATDAMLDDLPSQCGFASRGRRTDYPELSEADATTGELIERLHASWDRRYLCRAVDQPSLGVSCHFRSAADIRVLLHVLGDCG